MGKEGAHDPFAQGLGGGFTSGGNAAGWMRRLMGRRGETVFRSLRVGWAHVGLVG